MNYRMDEIRSTRAPTLREDQLAILRHYGQVRKTDVGEVLFRAGDTSNDFIVILEGLVEVIDDFAGEARTIGTFLAGRFLGELNMLTGQAMYLTAVVREGGEVLAIPRKGLKEIVTDEPNLSDIINKAFLARRAYMIRTGLGLRIIGARRSSDAARLREIAARNRVPHVWIELEKDPEAKALLEEFGANPSETPVTIWQGKVVLCQRGRRSPGTDLRPRGSGGWSCGPGCVGLRGIRGPLHPRTRVGGPGRPGWHLLEDRELPGLSRRPLRLRARQPCPGSSRQVRSPHRSAPAGRRSEEGERPLPYSALRGR